jgi:hypothetical protein
MGDRLTGKQGLVTALLLCVINPTVVVFSFRVRVTRNALDKSSLTWRMKSL